MPHAPFRRRRVPFKRAGRAAKCRGAALAGGACRVLPLKAANAVLDPSGGTITPQVVPPSLPAGALAIRSGARGRRCRGSPLKHQMPCFTPQGRKAVVSAGARSGGACEGTLCMHHSQALAHAPPSFPPPQHPHAPASFQIPSFHTLQLAAASCSPPSMIRQRVREIGTARGSGTDRESGTARFEAVGGPRRGCLLPYGRAHRPIQQCTEGEQNRKEHCKRTGTRTEGQKGTRTEGQKGIRTEGHKETQGHKDRIN